MENKEKTESGSWLTGGLYPSMPISIVLMKAGSLFRLAPLDQIKQWLDNEGSKASLEHRQILVAIVAHPHFSEVARKNFSMALIQLPRDHKFFQGLSETALKDVSSLKELVESEILTSDTSIQIVLPHRIRLFNRTHPNLILAWLNGEGSKAELEDREALVKIMSPKNIPDRARTRFAKALSNLPEEHPFFQGFSEETHQYVKGILEEVEESQKKPPLKKQRTKGEKKIAPPAQLPPEKAKAALTLAPLTMPSWEERIRQEEAMLPSIYTLLDEERMELSSLSTKLALIYQRKFGNTSIQQLCGVLRQSIDDYIKKLPPSTALPAVSFQPSATLPPIRESEKSLQWKALSDWASSAINTHAADTSETIEHVRRLSEKLSQYPYETGPADWKKSCLEEAEAIASDMRETSPEESRELYRIIGRLTQPELSSPPSFSRA